MSSVRDYDRVAFASFKLYARGTMLEIVRRDLMDDWMQEIALAAELGRRGNLDYRAFCNMCARTAYAALRAMGFRRREFRVDGHVKYGHWENAHLSAADAVLFAA